ncbi:MAG TPA: tripartite tricarboxylate transporter substrate binding protein [Ramlibacter sp.]|uniref:tripartite tricarboxylate transporter substrate binding protein n=1 Tax=Ramlibacter sp. TaxID=1917967 RepID=UPI002C8CC0E5|nr:tripartite tricarboxylate transporter substrate binding protein [Ramlibacter sp.]HVZ46490.1 tripartite tricarboxylate transporter substrate binding protein [Ramlibacter sp.]
MRLGSMIQFSRQGARVAAILASVAIAATAAHAQDPFPTRAVKIVVSAPPGGQTDSLARFLGDGLSKRWGQPVVVENIPGAGQTIGTAKVAHSPPDGYTLHLAMHATFTRKLYYTSLNYEPTALTPLLQLGEAGYALVARPDLPAKDVRELIAYAKQQEGRTSLGLLGMGGDSHVRMVIFGLRNGIKFTQAAYKGESDILNALAGSHLDIAMVSLSSALALVPKVKIIAITSAERNPAAKDLPTFAESGVQDFSFGIRYFLVGPPDMNQALQKKIHEDAAAVMAAPDAAAMLARLQLTPSDRSLDAARKGAAAEVESFRRIMAESKLEPQR